MTHPDGKCVCQICVCGRHRCPHNRGTLGQGPIKNECALTSEYQTAYEPMDYQPPRPAIRPEVRCVARTGAKPNMTTMYGQTFIPHKVKPRYVHPRSEYVASTKAMDLMSTYDKDYMPKAGNRCDSFKPRDAYTPSGSPMQKHTSYGLTYKEHSPEERAWCRSSLMRHKETIAPGTGAFNVSSTMKEDFIRHENPERAELIRPKMETMAQRDKFDPMSTYTTEYTSKPYTPVPDMRKRETYAAPETPMEVTTTAQSDYQPHMNRKVVQPYRPKVPYNPTKARMEKDTTASLAYKEWPLHKKERYPWASRKSLAQSNTPFTKNSSYQRDFVSPASCERAKLARPGGEELDLAHGPKTGMLKTTQYTEQFVPHMDARKERSFKKIQVYQPPMEQMQLTSSYQDNFQGEYSAAPVPHRPNLRNADDAKRKPADFNTEYYDSYKGSRPTTCPATQLSGKESEKTEFGTFNKTGVSNGHHYYQVTESSKAKQVNKSPIIQAEAKVEVAKQEAQKSSAQAEKANARNSTPKQADKNAAKADRSRANNTTQTGASVLKVTLDKAMASTQTSSHVEKLGVRSPAMKQPILA